MKTILTPIDFSDVSQRVIEVAVSMARSMKGTVVLLNVIRPPQFVAAYDMELENLAEMTAAMEKSADTQLLALKKVLDKKSVKTRLLRMSGYPADDILEQAKKLPADYIVMGSHGHTALYDLILGSTTSAVIKRATCPVIVVPPEEKTQRKPAKKTRTSRRRVALAA